MKRNKRGNKAAKVGSKARGTRGYPERLTSVASIGRTDMERK